jgi:hypothetical protein
LECERSENEKEVGKWTVEFRKRSCNKSWNPQQQIAYFFDSMYAHNFYEHTNLPSKIVQKDVHTIQISYLSIR